MTDIIRPGEPAFTVEGFRFGQPHSVDAKDLDAAIGTAVWAIEDNHFMPRSIKNISGEIVLEEEELEKRMNEYRDKFDI